MAKKRSLKWQITTSINNCFTPGRSKRSDKFQGGLEWHVYSYAHKDDLHDTGNALVAFCSNQGVRMLKDINYKHVQAFLDEQAKTNNDMSLKKLFSHLGKLERIVQHTFAGSRIDWGIQNHVVVPASEKRDGYVRDIVMPDSVVQQVIDTLKKGTTQVWKALELSRCMGLRVEETVGIRVKNIIFDDSEDGFGKINLTKGCGSKGNRPRVIPIPSAKVREILQELVEGLDLDEYVVRNSRTGGKLTPNAVTRRFSEILRKLGLYETYRGNLNHALRKLFATSYYNNYRETHTRKESVEKVNTILGHGKQRSEAELRHYVFDIW